MESQPDDAVTPPPMPPAPDGKEAATPPVLDESGFISMPPGMADLDSGTYRLEQRRPEPVAKSAPVFVPTVVPGSLVSFPPATPAPAEPEESTQLAVPRAAEVEDATVVAPPRRAAWSLLVPGADTVRLQPGVTLLGRGPAPFEAWPDARLLPLVDPRKSVSKTHAALEVEPHGALRVHDLDSTNGVWISYPNGDEVDVLPGTPQPVEDGGTIHLGEFELLARRG